MRQADCWRRVIGQPGDVRHEPKTAADIWLGQGGEKDVPFDDERTLDALATIWVKAVYWRPAA